MSFEFFSLKNKKGLAFSEILLDLYPETRESLLKIETLDLSYQNCLKNFDLILNVIKTSMNPPNYLETFTAEDLFENDQKLVILLAFLYNEKKNQCLSNRNKTNQQEKTQFNNKISAKKPPLAPQPQQIMNEKNEIPSSDLPEKNKKPDFLRELNKNYNVIQPKQQNYYSKQETPKEIANNFNNFEYNKEEVSRKAANLPTPETFMEKPYFQEIENIRKNISEKKKTNTLTSEPVQKPYFQENLSFEKKDNEFMKNNNLNSTAFYKKPSNSATIPHSFSKETWKNYNHIFEISDSKSLPPPYLYENSNQESTNNNIFSNLLSKFDGTLKKKEETSRANPSKPLFIPNKSPIPKKNNENLSENMEINAIPTKKPVTLNSILKNPLTKQKNMSFSVAKESKESFPPPSSNLKNKLYEWLLSINLIKENIKVNLNKFHKICRNGVIFADIINRMESKNEVLTGIARKPRKTAEIHANYTKVFDFLAKFEKMNKRCLYCYEAFLEGKEEPFWAFLDDIWHFYHNKMSKYDIRYQNTKAVLSLNESRRLNSSIKKTEVSNTSYEEIICPNVMINNNSNNFQMNSNNNNFFNKSIRDQNNNSIISLVKGKLL